MHITIDQQLAIWLNQSLNLGHSWQLFWGYLNHQNETWLNVVFMLGLNLSAIFTLAKPQRRAAFFSVLYFWLFFQFVLYATHFIFSTWLSIHRLSPSLVISPWLSLGELLNMEQLKTFSENSFPAGHALVLVYWAWFTCRLFKANWVRVLSIATVIVLTMPRLISGAHWPSDIVFTIFYATIWFYLASSVHKLFSFNLANKA